MTEDKKWSREGEKEEKIEIEVLAEAEAIVNAEVIPTTWENSDEKPTYDTHLKFIGKKLSDINNNLNQTNENLWWLSIGIKVSFASCIVIIGVWMMIVGTTELIFLTIIGAIIGILGIIILLFFVFQIIRKFSELEV